MKILDNFNNNNEIIIESIWIVINLCYNFESGQYFTNKNSIKILGNFFIENKELILQLLFINFSIILNN